MRLACKCVIEWFMDVYEWMSKWRENVDCTHNLACLKAYITPEIPKYLIISTLQRLYVSLYIHEHTKFVVIRSVTILLLTYLLACQLFCLWKKLSSFDSALCLVYRKSHATMPGMMAMANVRIFFSSWVCFFVRKGMLFPPVAVWLEPLVYFLPDEKWHTRTDIKACIRPSPFNKVDIQSFFSYEVIRSSEFFMTERSRVVWQMIIITLISIIVSISVVYTRIHVYFFMYEIHTPDHYDYDYDDDSRVNSRTFAIKR